MKTNIVKYAVYCLLSNTKAIKVKFLDIPFETFDAYVPESHIVSENQVLKGKNTFQENNSQQMAQSDPIHESSYDWTWTDKPKTIEREFEIWARKKKPVNYAIDSEITDSLNSIKVAEAIVGAQMASPTDVKELAKDLDDPFKVPYYIADENDEDEDTKETRKSILMAEQMLGRKFTLDGSDADVQKQMVKEATQLRTVEKDLARAGINVANKPVIQEAKPETPPAPPKPAPKKAEKPKSGARKEEKPKNKNKDDHKHVHEDDDHNKDHGHPPPQDDEQMASHEDFGHKFDKKDSIHENSHEHDHDKHHDHHDKHSNDAEGKLLK